MAGFPISLTIAVWATCACWIVAAAAHFFDAENQIVAPLVIVGGLTGVAEWLIRRAK